MNEEKLYQSCLSCEHRGVCLQRGLAIFLMFIQTGREEEAECAKKNLDISAQCDHYKQEKERYEND